MSATASAALSLEDELGDVLEKAMRRSGLTEEELAVRSGVPAARILDAIDYRPDLTAEELRRLAAALQLKEHMRRRDIEHRSGDGASKSRG